jgi:nifR3 family TIM-barrel protein
MCAAAQWLEAYGVSSIDINMGCPVHKVVRGGGGSAMMCDATRSIELVRAVVEAVNIPVTVKMRLGWDEHSLSAPFFAREFEQVGVAAVTIHGRTRAQGFGGSVNHDGIRAVVEAVERIPVIGNGDVRTIEDAALMLRRTGCAGVAIGRGALLNPWIFSQLQRIETSSPPLPPPTWGDRVDFMSRHFELQVQERGERRGCLTFRKVARWYCKVLKPGRELHRRLMMISSCAEFEAIVRTLRERPEYHDRRSCEPDRELIATPTGPNERW